MTDGVMLALKLEPSCLYLLFGVLVGRVRFATHPPDAETARMIPPPLRWIWGIKRP